MLMMNKLATTILIGTSMPLSVCAWVTAPAPRMTGTTRLMAISTSTTRRSFFGAIASSTTIVAAPWMAYANEELVEVPEDAKMEEVVATNKEEPVLVADSSSSSSDENADEPELDDVVDEQSSSEPKESQDIVEVSSQEEHGEVTLALDAKIEESIETVEAASVEVASEPANEDEPTIMATTAADNSKTKLFQDLFEERKAVSSDDDMDAFRTKLKGLIAADSTFVEAFESFLDNLTLASA